MTQQPMLSQKRQNKFGDNYFVEVSQGAFAKHSSEAVFSTHFSDLLTTDEMLYIVVGSDSGLLYNYIKLKALPAGVKFIFIDFQNVLEACDFVEEGQEVWVGSVRLVNQDFEFKRILGEFESYLIRKRLKIVKSLAVVDALPGTSYGDLWDEIYAKYQNFYTWNMVAQSSFQFENARLFNATDNILPLIDYKDTLHGSTAIVLGGGPTLDDAIDWIKKNQNQLIIFSAARIARRLASEGIVPDFFVSVDPHNVSFDNSKGIFEFEDQAILLNSYHVNPKVLSQWGGLASYTGLKYGWKNDTYTKNLNSPGPTVINTAMAIATDLGCQNVILSGVDLCFAKGRSYESGSDEEKFSAHLAYADALTVESNSGEKTRTKHRYITTLESMEKLVKVCKDAHPEMQFYSIGLHSASIKGVEYREPETIDFINPSSKALVNALKEKLVVSQEQRLAYTVQTIDELGVQLERFKDVQKLARDALEVMPKLYAENSSDPKLKVMNKIQKLRKKVNHILGVDGDLLMSYNTNNFAETYKPVEDQDNLNRDEVSYQLTEFFKGVDSATSQYQYLLERSLERAELRMDELLDACLPSDLYPRWKKWQEFGRARLWCKWHDGIEVQDDEVALLQQSISSFVQELTRTDTRHVQNLKRKTQDLPTLIKRAERALVTHDISEVEGLIEHAKQLDNSEHKIDFTVLLRAMLAEISGNNVEATQLYQQVQVALLKHVALKRLLNFAMVSHRHNESLQLLESLCQFSLDYMVPYSDLLALLDQNEMAAEVLKIYLQKKPEKVGAHIKLAQRYIALFKNEEAKQTLLKVVELDENNKTAAHLLSTI